MRRTDRRLEQTRAVARDLAAAVVASGLLLVLAGWAGWLDAIHGLGHRFDPFPMQEAVVAFGAMLSSSAIFLGLRRREAGAAVAARRWAEAEVARRDATLRAAARVGGRFLGAPTWDECVDDVLAELGEAADVSRAFLFRNQPGEDGELEMVQIHEWSAPRIRSMVGHPWWERVPYRELPRWEEELSARHVIAGNVSALPEAERTVYAETVPDVRSILIVPVFTGDRWWGFLGFDECTRERAWTSAEIDTLLAAAAALGGAVRRWHAEVELREAEIRYRSLVEQTPAVTYAWELEPCTDAPLRGYVSPQIVSLLGFTPEEWNRRATFWEERLHPEDRDRVLAEDRRIRAARSPYELEYRYIAKDGSVVWVHDRGTFLDLGPGRSLLQGVLIDITDRKRAEEEREVLLGRLVAAQEEERRRIAGDIHDDSVQKMTAVGLRLRRLRELVDDPAQLEALDRLERTVSLSIGRLRRLLFELRPPALDREGLAPALRQYLAEVAEDGGFEVHLDDRLSEEAPAETRTIVYRIAQEALTNVRKHAGASRVDVLVIGRDRGVHVRIRDDGRGLDTRAASPSAVDHHGLAAMRDRAELAGGWWRLDSSPGKGTAVEFWVPCTPARIAPRSGAPPRSTMPPSEPWPRSEAPGDRSPAAAGSPVAEWGPG